jgi:hypothetical protein
MDVTKPEFHWSHSATHRVELFPEGGFLVNINERCAIVVLIFPMPFCRVGKIPAHSDLFEHMDDVLAAAPPTIP